MHAERYWLSQATVDAIERTRARGGRVVAVGTTTVRVLESVADEDGRLEARSGSTELFLRPGSTFHVVDALLTNFHLPRSSLLMLVSAFAGRTGLGPVPRGGRAGVPLLQLRRRDAAPGAAEGLRAPFSGCEGSNPAVS